MQIDLANGSVAHPIVGRAHINTSLVSVHFLNYVRRSHVLILACSRCTVSGPSGRSSVEKCDAGERDTEKDRFTNKPEAVVSSLLYIPAGPLAKRVQ